MRTIAGSENHRRCVVRLQRDRAALRALRELGVSDDAVDRYQLGLASEQTDPRTGLRLRRSVRFPILGAAPGHPSGYGALALDGVTAADSASLSNGRRENPLTYWSRPLAPGATVRVVASVGDLWRTVGASPDPDAGPTLVAPSHDGGVPVEWRAPAFWRRFAIVELDDGVTGEARQLVEPYTSAPSQLHQQAGIARAVEATVAAPVVRESPPPASLRRARAPVLRSRTDADWAAPAMSLANTVVGGYAYYAFPVERVDNGVSGEVALHSYAPAVLRDDGQVLRCAALPHPPGTPPHARVHVLTDGIRILPDAAAAGSHATWSGAGIRRFVSARQAGTAPCRQASALFDDVDRLLRSRVDLPDDDAYALVGCFVMLTHVFRAFDVLPILLATGPSQSGKSELAGIVADLGFNATMIGEATAASIIRLAELSGGLVVVDDCDRLAAAGGGAQDLRRLLRVGYKASTARKAVVEPTGRVRLVDLFGPRMVTNTTGADEALLSRMIVVATAQRCGVTPTPVTDVAAEPAALRDELHAWGLATVKWFQEVARAWPSSIERADEISRPILAIANTVGAEMSARVSAALAFPAEVAIRPSDEEIVERALAGLASAGVGREVAMSRVAMEVALVADADGVAMTGSLASPEWLGGRLAASGMRNEAVAVSRRRHMGVITRIYPVAGAWREGAKALVGDDDPFGFCREGFCRDCRYRSVCTRIVPALEGRRRRAGVPG